MTGVSAGTQIQLGSVTSANAEALVRVRLNDTAITRGGPSLRQTATNTFYGARLNSNNNTFLINKTIAGTPTDLFSTAFTVSITTFYWIRFRIVGTKLEARVWADGSGEPSTWTVSGTDSSITGAGGFGITTNSNSSASTWDFDSYTVTDAVSYPDVASRFGLTSIVATTKNALTRFRLLAAKSVDAVSRFRLKSAIVSKDALNRLRVQSGVLPHDALSRLRLKSATQNKDGVSRFRQLSTKSVDVLSRFRLVITPLRDVVSRLRVQSALQNKDALNRFRQLVVKRMDTATRLRVSSSVQFKDALSRWRQQSGVLTHDVLTRLGLTVPGYSATVLRDTPQAYYRLDETSGTIARDSTANHYDGTITGTVALAQAAVITHDTDASMAFDGSTGYIALPAGITPTGWGAFTAECWFLYSVGGYAGGRVLSNGHTDVGGGGFQLNVNATSGGLASIATGVSAANLYWSSSTFTAGTPYHYVLTYDGTTAYAYLNGIQVGSSALSGTIATSGYPVNIGRGSYGNDYANALIDEVALYNYALTAGQVATHYRVGVPLNKDAVSRFRLQSGTLFHDVSSRLRVLATTLRDTPTRFRLQSALLKRDTVTRFRLSISLLKDSASRFRLLATKSVDGITRFRQQSVLIRKDVLSRLRVQSGILFRDAPSRFRLVIAAFKDGQSRFRVQSGVLTKDALSRFRLQLASQRTSDILTRFRLLATKSIDTLSRFRVQSIVQAKDIEARLRVQSGTTYKNAVTRFRLVVVSLKDAPFRFRLQSGTQFKNVVARLRVQSGVTPHDTPTRLRLRSATLLRDVGARFRVLVAGSKDTLGRFRQQSGTLPHDALSRIRLQSSLQVKHTLTRFRLMVVGIARDVPVRFRLLATKSIDVTTRLRVRSLVQNKDTPSRVRVMSGVLTRDTRVRFRVLDTRRFDVVARFRLVLPGVGIRDARCLFRLIEATSPITFHAPRGNMLMQAARGLEDVQSARGNTQEHASRGILELEEAV